VQIGAEEEIDGKLNDLIMQQQLKNLESSFIKNFVAIDSIITQTLNAHEDIINIQPLEEITKFQEKMVIPLPRVTKIKPEELLKRAKRSKILEDSQVTIRMIIPIEQDIDYTEWIIINVPDLNGNAIHLGDSEVAYNVVIDNSNMTMFKPIEKREIYENIDIEPIIPCLKAIMEHKPLEEVCEREILSIK
jgi:hypothetical protein